MDGHPLAGESIAKTILSSTDSKLSLQDLNTKVTIPQAETQYYKITWKLLREVKNVQ